MTSRHHAGSAFTGFLRFSRTSAFGSWAPVADALAEKTSLAEQSGDDEPNELIAPAPIVYDASASDF